MATGRYISDLEAGDDLGRVFYTVSAFTVREYCHAVEMSAEMFLGADNPVAPPTLVHLDKLKLYEVACPGGTGPSARLHVEFDATYHAPVNVGTEIEVTGRVTERFVKRGRTYVITEITMRRAQTGEVLVSYRDTIILGYKTDADTKAEVSA